MTQTGQNDQTCIQIFEPFIRLGKLTLAQSVQENVAGFTLQLLSTIIVHQEIGCPYVPLC